MRYIELIAERPLTWGLFLLYLAVTSYLAWLGHKRTTDLKSFALGKGDMSPVVVGITLAASVASTATFVINPGFVYAHGMSAFMHLGVAAGLGVITGLLTMSFGFRRIGAKSKVLTLPQWMGERYGSKSITLAFAVVNLLSLSFVVLIVGGTSIVMQTALGLTNFEALALTCGFVFSYVLIGGTYAHAYTNTLQGMIMVVVSIVIVAGGFTYLGDGFGPFMDRVAEKGPELTQVINEKSPLFSSFFSVFVSGFIVGFALVCQPHIMTKALYVKTDRDVRRYLIVAIGTMLIFTSLLLVGLYARVMDLPDSAFINPDTGLFSQDRVMAVYLVNTFDPVWLSIITVALLAAGMSTLDGILVALSTIAANDLFLNVAKRTPKFASLTDDRQAQIAHRVSQAVLILLGLAAFFIALDPPTSLGIFGQVGVYAIVSASTIPLLGGIMVKSMNRTCAAAAATTGIVVHLVCYGWAYSALSTGARGTPIELGFANPGVTATYGLIASAVVAVAVHLLTRSDSNAQASAASSNDGLTAKSALSSPTGDADVDSTEALDVIGPDDVAMQYRPGLAPSKS